MAEEWRNSAPARWENRRLEGGSCLHVACTAGAVTIRVAEVLICASASSLHPCLLPLTIFFFPSFPLERWWDRVGEYGTAHCITYLDRI